MRTAPWKHPENKKERKKRFPFLALKKPFNIFYFIWMLRCKRFIVFNRTIKLKVSDFPALSWRALMMHVHLGSLLVMSECHDDEKNCTSWMNNVWISLQEKHSSEWGTGIPQTAVIEVPVWLTQMQKFKHMILISFSLYFSLPLHETFNILHLESLNWDNYFKSFFSN